MSAYDRLLLPENLNYAWRKAKKLYRMADGYVDHCEIGEFELDLEHRLARIYEQFQKGHYRLSKLRPLPRPKKIDNELAVDRQYFHVRVDDQVAWIAVVNALGPELDRIMPSWSYGNRLYRPAWYEERDDQRSALEIGPYRHASAHLYRKFQHSWPLFRRHIALTAKAMVRGHPPEVSELDRADRLAAASAEKDKLPYLQPDFWRKSVNGRTGTDIHWASIDLKQFYPSLSTYAVLQGLLTEPVLGQSDDKMRALLHSMLRFQLDRTDVQPEALAHVEPKFGGHRIHGIPTGLFASGFLANVAMLSVDTTIDERIKDQRSIAHFRFVDDHTVLANNFDELCGWISWYEDLLNQRGIGVTINNHKSDPESLGAWLEHLKSLPKGRVVTSRNAKAHRDVAYKDTKLDGSNPIKLLTKTLGQVSAIATTNANLLDDEDLRERLKYLEWLLLADIPEREIRPDTRAAFAATQIAALTPMLIQEADGLVDAARALATLATQAPKPNKASKTEIASYQQKLLDKQIDYKMRLAAHTDEERRHLHHCFSLLLQAFREYPGKARLFYKLHDYCRMTGHNGLAEIVRWIKETRKLKRTVWADYYTGLSMQILSKSVIAATRIATSTNRQRLEFRAAIDHLTDVASLNPTEFSIPKLRESWFHAVGRQEFTVALFAGAASIRELAHYKELATKLGELAQSYLNITTTGISAWHLSGGRSAGVWAHILESGLSIDEKPSAIWQDFERSFTYANNRADFNAARRYPELLSDRAWKYSLEADIAFYLEDSGWFRDSLAAHPERMKDALSSSKIAVRRAAHSSQLENAEWRTLVEWTEFVMTHCSPFDPRRSEWTALEIIRQIVAPIIANISIGERRLDNLHPSNILIPQAWISQFPKSHDYTSVSWENWRTHVRTIETKRIPRHRKVSESIVDYRYFARSNTGRKLNDWERRLVSVGRLLLGLLRLNHEAPRLWNIRGNEQIIGLPKAQAFQSLSISTPTLRLLEGCLSARSAEARTMISTPELFGLASSTEAKDTEFDPPTLLGTNDLLKAIEHAQEVLIENQLAVAMNQPRQLIPFRIRDFAIGSEAPEEDSGPDE